MGSSSSTSQEQKSVVRDESKDDVCMTAEDKAKADKFLKDLEKSDKYWADLAASWNINGEVSKTTLIESMRGMVSQSSGYSTMLKEMEKPISKSADAYIHFEELLNDPWMIKKHNDKVTKARLIYHEYWSLLFETSTAVNKILVASKRAIKAIDLYQLEIECQSIPDMSTIDTCLNRLTSWNESCKCLNLLQSRFETLGKLVDEQRQEWKKLEQDRKNEFKKSLRSAAWFFGGIVAVAAIGATIAFTGGVTAVVIGAAYLTWVEIAAIIGLGVLGGVEVYLGRKVLKRWKQWKKCHEARQRCDRISESIKIVQNCLDKVSSGSKKVQQGIGSLIGKISNISGTIEDVKDAKENLENKMAKNSNSQNNKIIERIVQGITKDFVTIKKDLKDLNNACNECINHVESCKKEIVDAVNGK